MTSLISVRLDDDLILTMKLKAETLHLSQTDYIRRAITYMNKLTEKRERKRRLQQASLRVRKESMKINAEFSDIEHDPEAQKR